MLENDKPLDDDSDCNGDGGEPLPEPKAIAMPQTVMFSEFEIEILPHTITVRRVETRTQVISGYTVPAAKDSDSSDGEDDADSTVWDKVSSLQKSQDLLGKFQLIKVLIFIFHHLRFSPTKIATSLIRRLSISNPRPNL